MASCQAFRPNLPSNGLATFTKNAMCHQVLPSVWIEGAFSSDRNMEKAVDQWRRGGTGTFDTEASPHMKQVVQLQGNPEKPRA